MKMKHHGRYVCIFVFMLYLIFGLCLGTESAEMDSGQEDVRVPLYLAVPYAIAGAEFEIEYTSGLKFKSFEKSEAVQSAFTTPVVEKDGKTYFGFFNKSNDYEPLDGILDIGHMIFEYSGEGDQSIKVTEAKYVTVINKDTTSSELFVLEKTINVPLADGASLLVEKEPTFMQWWIILVLSFIVIALTGFAFYRIRTKTITIDKEEI